MDPFTIGGGLDFGSRRRQAAFPPLDEPSTTSAVENLTSGALSGLGWVGSMQDKLFGGRAIRAGLSGLGTGNFRDMLSIIPGSDVLGITDPAETVRGEDLLWQAGYDPSQGNWLERNLAGPALEIATDPSTWLGGIGALTAAGKSARASGTLTKGFLPAVKAGERRLFPIPGLTGSTAAAVAGKVGGAASAIGNVGLNLAEKVPLAGRGVGVLREQAVPQLKSLFSRVAGPVAQRDIQAAHATKFIPTQEALDIANRTQAARWHNQLQSAIDAGATKPDLMRRLYEDLEQVPVPTSTPSAVPHATLLQNLVGEMRPYLDRLRAEELALGNISRENLSSWGLKYAPRQALAAAKGGQAASHAHLLPTINASQKRRKDIFDLPGGAMQVEDFLRDPRLTGTARTLKPTAAADVIKTSILSRAGLDPTTGIPLSPDVLDVALPRQARKLSRWLGKRDAPLGADESFWVPDVIEMMERRGRHSAEARGASTAIYDVINRTQAAVPGGVGTTRVGIPDVLKAARLQGQPALEHAARAVGLNPAAILATAATPGDLTPLRQALVGFSLPADVAKGVTKLMTRYNPPVEELATPRMWGDSLLNLTKAGLYAIWPASHVRNALSGTFENALAGTRPGNPAYGDAARLLGGQGIEVGLPHNVVGPPKYAGLTPDEQRLRLIEEMYGQGIIGTPQGEALQAVGIPQHAVGAGNPSLPRGTGTIGGDLRQIGANLKAGLATPEGRDPLGVAGVGARTEDTNALVKAGRAVGTRVEDRLRVAQYLDLRRKGYVPEAARAAVERAHFNYQDLADFEKEYMKRIVPFYCVPDDCEILTRRGWLTVDELQLDEAVLALDHDTGESHWVACQDKAVFDYDGVLMTLGGEREEFLFTVDHRWPVIQTSNPASGTVKNRLIKRGFELRSNHSVPRTAEYRGTDSIANPREAAMIGWVVTDGHMKHDGNHVGITVYQSPGKYLQEILDLFGADGKAGNPHPDSGVVPVYISGETRRRLVELLPRKDAIVDFVCHLSREAAESCLDAMKKAEACSCGGYVETGYHNFFAQNQGPVLDAFQVLCSLCGLVAHKCPRGAYISSKMTAKKVAGALGTVWYKGRVWCPQTQYGTWLMRRNGRIIWTGNTFSRKNVPKQFQRAIEQPAQVGVPIRLAQGGQDEGYVPEYLRSGLALPVGEEQEGVQRYLSQLGLPFEEAFNRLKIGTTPLDTLMKTGMGLASTVRGEIQSPLELVTGKDFFTGRDLRDLHVGKVESLGGLLPHDVAILASEAVQGMPPARLVGTLNRLLDERKWQGGVGPGVLAHAASLLTGAKLTDVDVEKWKAIDARRQVERLLQDDQQVRESTDYWLPKELRAQATPQQEFLLRLNASLRARAKEAVEKQQRLGVQLR